MKKILLSIFFLLIFAVPSWSATCTFQSGGVDLNWSTVGNWDCGHVPVADDVVKLTNGLIAVWDVANGARIPPTSGTIASLSTTNATDTGQVTVDISDAACHTSNACSLNVAGAITAGYKPTAEGFVRVTGTTDHYVTIVAGGDGAVGGGNSSATALVNASVGGTVNLTGNCKGGTGTNAPGCYNTGAGAFLNPSGNCTGGSGAGSNGYTNSASSGLGTIGGNAIGGGKDSSAGVHNIATTNGLNLSGNIVNTATTVGWSGRPPIWTVTNAAHYLELSTGVKLYADTDPGVANVKKDTTYYFQSGTVKTGTYEGGGGGAWGF